MLSPRQFSLFCYLVGTPIEHVSVQFMLAYARSTSCPAAAHAVLHSFVLCSCRMPLFIYVFESAVEASLMTLPSLVQLLLLLLLPPFLILLLLLPLLLLLLLPLLHQCCLPSQCP